MVRASEGRRPLVRQQLDALALMEIAVDRPDLDAERAFERHRIGRHEGDRPTQLTREAATSVPTQPPPTTTTRRAVAAAARIASASSSVRR